MILNTQPACVSYFPMESHRAISYIWYPVLGKADRTAPAPPPPFPLAPRCSICSLVDGAKCPIYDFHGMDAEPEVPVSAMGHLCLVLVLTVAHIDLHVSWYCSLGPDTSIQLTATNGRGTTLVVVWVCMLWFLQPLPHNYENERNLLTS